MTERPFWQGRALRELSAEQWESLCDGCGKCCLHKLEDIDDGEVYYTDIACQYLDCQTAQCQDYSNRLTNVAQCLDLTIDTLPEYSAWLPSSCAYLLVATGQPLPLWHPLVSGTKETVKTAGCSVAGRVVSEAHFTGDLEDRVIHWVDEWS